MSSYPSEARSPRTRASPLPTSIGEFSTKTNRGRTSPTIRAMWLHMPDRSPSMPAPFPAALMSWHSYGNPPQMASSLDTPFHIANASAHSGLSCLSDLISSHTGKTGRSPSSCRCSRTRLGYSSISQAPIGVCPRMASARIPPPAPANRCKVYMTNSLFSSLGVLIVVRRIPPGVFRFWQALKVFYPVVRLIFVDVMNIVSG